MGAEREYREAIKQDPSDPAAHRNLGNILKARGNFVEAENE